MILNRFSMIFSNSTFERKKRGELLKFIDVPVLTDKNSTSVHLMFFITFALS